MSIELLEKNWNLIMHKVINPLWNNKFKTMYFSVKLDKSDFESLAGLELTKAFKIFNPEKSNILTFSTTVIARKANTEIRNMNRDKRKVSVISESLNRFLDDEDGQTLENIIKNIEQQDNRNNLDIYALESELYKFLKPKERKIFQMFILNYDDTEIAKYLNIDIKDILNLKRKLSECSNLRRVFRLLGYLGGNKNEI